MHPETIPTLCSPNLVISALSLCTFSSSFCPSWTTVSLNPLVLVGDKLQSSARTYSFLKHQTFGERSTIASPPPPPPPSLLWLLVQLQQPVNHFVPSLPSYNFSNVAVFFWAPNMESSVQTVLSVLRGLLQILLLFTNESLEDISTPRSVFSGSTTTSAASKSLWVRALQ